MGLWQCNDDDNAGATMKDTATLDDVCCDEYAARDSSGDGKVRRNGWLAVEWSSGNDGARYSLLP